MNEAGTHAKAWKILKNRKLILALAAIIPALLIGLIIAFDITVGISFLLVGLALLAISSEKAVEHSIGIATALRLSPLMIGLVVVSLGTDFPEIINSIISSALGHIDINVGDSFGSALTQITLALGLLPFIGGAFRVKREEIVVMGACEILAFIASISMVEKGYISRMNAVFMVASWPLLMLITRTLMKGPPTLDRPNQGLPHHLLLAGLGFAGVAVGGYTVVQSVISISGLLSIPEFYVSFFIVAFGTSLPEIVVDLTAIRRKQYEIAIGDAIGSSMIDAGFSIGAGTLFFPGAVTASIAEKTGLYALMCSIVVVSSLALRQKHDRKSGVLFITLYALAYLAILTVS
jgi:cation:H+ antiporter